LRRTGQHRRSEKVARPVADAQNAHRKPADQESADDRRGRVDPPFRAQQQKQRQPEHQSVGERDRQGEDGCVGRAGDHAECDRRRNRRRNDGDERTSNQPKHPHVSARPRGPMDRTTGASKQRAVQRHVIKTRPRSVQVVGVSEEALDVLTKSVVKVIGEL
jgi:hypothetical protein